MKRSFITVLIPLISLLTSCANKNVRSDILEFIASFSIDSAIANYPVASYTREDISIENDKTSKVITTMSINRSDHNNLAYDYREITYEEEVEKSNIHRYIEKNNDEYTYVTDSSSLTKSEEEVNALINTFFYTYTSDNIYLGGMFMGDTFRDIIPDIQDLVVIDNENKLLVYSYLNIMNDENKEVKIEQIVTLDNYGMLVKEDMKKTSDLGIFETHIAVKKM